MVLAIVLFARIVLWAAVLFLTVYAARHYWLAYTRLRVEKPRDTMELVGFILPKITVMVPMHNEERVAGDILQALVECDYDWNLLEIIPIDDRSTDRTAEIIDAYAARYPFIKPLHRTGGASGKPAALVEATQMAEGDILLLFDADYVPARVMLKLLVAPFSDPEVGAVMGRVVPHNIGDSLLSGLLSLERAAGYQSAQQARFNLGFTAQFGGTVGGVRRTALDAAGGWNPASLTEDTDLTFALLEKGWRVAYVNRAECYEEVPKSWLVRRRQLSRWVVGHTDCLHRYFSSITKSKHLDKWEKFDALTLLGLYLTAPVMVLGWFASLALFFIPEAHEVPLFIIALLFLSCLMFGNQATFVEIGVAAMLDGSRARVLLMPLNMLNYFASTLTITSALFSFYWKKFWGDSGPGWYKTKRTRQPGPPPANGGNGSPAYLFGGLRLSADLQRAQNGLYYYKHRELRG